MLFPMVGMCYKRRAVDSVAKGPPNMYEAGLGAVPRSGTESGQAAKEPVSRSVGGSTLQALAPGDDISRYCPVCSQRLTSRHCKLLCNVCGYYMSCADFY
jgi:hypothetical protein